MRVDKISYPPQVEREGVCYSRTEPLRFSASAMCSNPARQSKLNQPQILLGARDSGVEPETGIEPATCCLQDSCSAETELLGRAGSYCRA